MSLEIRGKRDPILETIAESLRAYEHDHPHADIALYRQNWASVRIRVIDPDFAGRDKASRDDEAWKYLDRLQDEVQSDISMLILITREEARDSLSNLEFDDPIPSRL